MAYIIAIGNQKGGRVRTITCLSPGVRLAEMEYSVLLVDLDPFTPYRSCTRDMWQHSALVGEIVDD